MNNFDAILNDPYGVLALIGLTVLVIVSLFVIILLFKLYAKFSLLNNVLDEQYAYIQQNIPKKSLVEKINTNSSELSASIATNTKVAQTLPELISHHVSSEVSLGLMPFGQEIRKLNEHTNISIDNLIDKLSQDHKLFAQALTTLNSEGYLTEWVDNFREVVEPLQKTSAALEDHYNTSQQVLKTVQALVVELAGVRTTAESSFERITTVVEHWEATENTHMRDIENRIMARLEEVADINDRVGNGLLEQQTATTQLLASNTQLNNSVREVMGIVEGLQHLSQRIDAQYQESYHKITQTTEKLVVEAAGLRQTSDGWLKRIASVIERWEADETTHMRSIEKRIMERLQEVAATHQKITDELSELQAVSVRVLKSQDQMQQSTQQAVEVMAHLQNLVQAIESKYHNILSVQESFQSSMQAQQQLFQSQLQTLLSEFESSLQQLTEQGTLLRRQLSEQGTKLFKYAETALHGLHDMVTHLHTVHTEMLIGFEKQHQQYMRDQQTIFQQQMNLMNDAGLLMNRLPTKGMQIALLILFLFHLVLMGILAYDVLKNQF